ncbi:MAG: hypothetical protein BWK73_37785 [Thiothrix lacustris]|uniref:Uncharacterized protein n=1 Tax=Thiothrix lacustris TaxID=525917 RepID=A0A1Y1QET5_9GAMM|nr:MAG: hypothetical protein BWK73_37785 [Thiothrix lacustris]
MTSSPQIETDQTGCTCTANIALLHTANPPDQHGANIRSRYRQLTTPKNEATPPASFLEILSLG